MDKREEALIVFVKNAVSGKVKTRLAADIGDQKALEVYKYLLSYTKGITDVSGFKKFIFFSDYIEEYGIWEGREYVKQVQKGEDLGEKMANAFMKVFQEGYDRVVIIGSDCLSLSSVHIVEAFKKLQECNIVIGPAEDGGYYLLGMSQFYPFLFKNKSWSTKNLFEETVKEIEGNKLSFSLLPQLSDIDTYQDLKKIKNYKALFSLPENE
ncbi:MAG: TIGR04282 family arsenosugar biosynthesis glycosyltransferase [Cytophagaceae bacterium]